MGGKSTWYDWYGITTKKKDSDKPSTPKQTFVPTTIRYGGEDVARTYQEGKGRDTRTVTEFMQSEADKQLEAQRKAAIAQYEPTINVFSPETQKSWMDVAETQKQQQLKQFNELYEPTIRKQREDYFARLGTLQSTPYLERQRELEKTQSEALQNIAADYVAKQEQLKANELANRYAYLNYLQGGLSQGQNTAYQTATGNLGYAQAGTNALNNFNLTNYQNTLSAYNAEQAKRAALYSALASAGQTAALAASDIRVKQNINKLGRINGINIYEFEYKPEYKLPEGKHIGVMAQEVEHIPNAVVEINGIKHVNYDIINEIMRAA